MSRRVFYIYWVLLFSVGLFGQTLELPKNIQSPNASSLGKYGDIPMNLSTGRANVNVPIYSLNDANIPLDISLSYDTGGVLVNDHPGWVGQNWSLNAGGVITRTMRGDFDEQETHGDLGHIQRGYLFTHATLKPLDWNTPTNLTNIAINAVQNYSPDLEPDIFTFSFMGFSGKFFLGEDGEWKVSSDSNIKVMIDLSDRVKPLNLESVGFVPYNISSPPVKTIGKIKLIDAEGNQYIFGGTMDAIEFNVSDFFDQSYNFMMASAWYLSDVIDKYGNNVYSFLYERGGYQASFFNHYKLNNYRLVSHSNLNSSCQQMDYLNVLTAPGQLILPSYLRKIQAFQSNVVVDFDSSESQSLHYSVNDRSLLESYVQWDHYKIIPGANNIREKALSSFFYLYHDMDGVTQLPPDMPWGQLTFESILKRLKWRKLDRISINGNILSKEINFNYNDDPKTRLRLESLKSSDDQAYEFSYIKFESLPNYLSKSVDHFGYYNGNDFSLDPGLHSRSRKSNVSMVQFGALNRIMFPTKGSTFFEYEPHKYSKTLNDNFQLDNEEGYIGGIRIKRKSEYDSNFLPIRSVDYLYTNTLNSRKSSGILVKKNKYIFPNWFSFRTPTHDVYADLFSINSIIPLSNFSGSFIEYSNVIEREVGKGYTVNNFSNYEDYPNKKGVSLVESNSIMEPKTEMGFRRGKIKLKAFYDENDHLLQTEKYDYKYNLMQKVRAFNYTWVEICKNSDFYIPVGTGYEIYYADNAQTEKITTIYNGTDSITNKETFYYDLKDNFGDQFLRSRRIEYPDKKTEIESYKYTFDVTSPAYTELANKREYSTISKENTLNNLPISKSEVKYSKVPVHDAKGNVTTGQNIFPNAYDASKFGNTLESELVIDKYDKYGNILMAHAKGKFYYYYYAYNGKYPILKIEGGSFTKNMDVEIESLIALCESSTSINSQIINAQQEIRELLPDHQITAYTYFPNIGIESISPPSGITEYYVYDDNYRLQAIKNSKNEIVKEFTYNYNSVDPLTGIFYNGERKDNFTKNDCPDGQDGGDYEYIIPFGKYSSFISQQDADSKAYQDLINNGQAEANFNETCEVKQCIRFSSFRNGVTVDKIGYRKVKVTIDLHFNNLYYDWNKGVTIAEIDLECSPAYKTFRYDIGTADPNAIWTVYVDVYGKMILKYDGDIAQIPHYQMSFIFYTD